MAKKDGAIRYSDLISPDNSINDLIKQLKELSETYTKVLGDIKAEAIELAASLNKVSGATEEGQQTTKKAATDAERLAKAQKELADAQGETAKKLEELKQAKNEANRINKLEVKLNQSAEGSYNRLSAQYSLNKIRLNAMSKEMREATEEGRKLEAETKDLYEEMKRLQESTGKFQLNVGNYTQASDAIIAYGDRLKESLGLNSQFGESLLALGKGGQESKAVFSAMGDGAKALGKTLLGLLSNPVFVAIAGIAAAGVAFKWWYDYNAGLVEATRLTQQFTGKSGGELKAYRNQVQAVAETFNVDFKETLIATNAVAKQFGISADEALRIIQDGFVSGANANGEFLDTLKEYPAYFREAGITADQFVAIIAQTNKQGIFSDKGVDAIKEANLRLREMTDATASALEGIGISSEQVQADLQSGAKTTFDVMQDVSEKLNELPESSQAVGTAIADIFGGPGEDAGLQYLKTLKDISTNLDEVKDKAGRLGELQEQQLQSQVELENALSALFDATGGSFEEMTTSLKVFVNNALTALIKGIIGVVNYFVDLYNESYAFRVLWNGIVANFKSGIDFIGNLFNYLMDVVKAAGKILKGTFTLDWDEVKQGFVDFGNSLPKLIKAQVKDMGKNYEEGFENIRKKVKPIEIPLVVDNKTNAPTANMAPVRNAILSQKDESKSGKQSKRKETPEEKFEREIAEDRKKRFNEDYKLELDDLKRYQSEKKESVENYVNDLNRLYTAEQTVLAGIRKMNEKKDDEPKDIYDLLGLELDDKGKEAINTSLQYALDAINTLMEARTAAANAAVEEANKEVDAAQEKLNAELEARRQGYANNVQMAQKELDLAKKNQEKALKEQEKAQKAQLALQAVMQATNLISATALILSQFGMPWSIPMIATMWAAFAAAQIKARQVTKQEQYGDGTVELLEGGSHQSGNDIDLGTKPDGTKRRAEGGEYFAVINKRNSRRYRKIIPDVINSLNNGTFANKYMQAYGGADGIVFNVTGNNPDLRELSSDVREIKEQNKLRIYIDKNGRTVEIYKNLTRRKS